MRCRCIGDITRVCPDAVTTARFPGKQKNPKQGIRTTTSTRQLIARNARHELPVKFTFAERMGMRYAREELHKAITETSLPSHHQKALRELVSIVRHPLFLGYLLYALGFVLIAFFAHILYLRFQ